MPNPDILTEIPPISGQDSFVVFDRYKREFCFPVHIHKEYELNLVYGARGATRIVGDSVCEISDRDLVLITGSYLEHAWLNGNFSRNADVHEVCVQFSPDLFESGFIDKKQFYPIKKMFEYARRGIAFSEETVSRVEPIVENLIRSEDRFDSVLNFLMLLNCLARESDYHILAQRSVSIENNVTYDMPRVNLLNDIRLGAASRMLIENPTKNVSEIAYKCGFNNLSNFNRIFKKGKGLTPSAFKTFYTQKKISV